MGEGGRDAPSLTRPVLPGALQAFPSMHLSTASGRCCLEGYRNDLTEAAVYRRRSGWFSAASIVVCWRGFWRAAIVSSLRARKHSGPLPDLQPHTNAQTHSVLHLNHRFTATFGAGTAEAVNLTSALLLHQINGCSLQDAARRFVAVYSDQIH